MCTFLCWPEEGAGVTGVCDPINVGTGKKTWAIWKKKEILLTSEPSL